MKKKILIGILCCICTATQLQAQLQKGTVYWGGTIGISGSLGKSATTNNSGTTLNSRNFIAPELQYGRFVNNTTVLGLGIEYNAEFYKTEFDLSQQKNTNVRQAIQLKPFVRKYKVLTDRWSLFVHGEIGSAYHWTKQAINGGTDGNYKHEYWENGVSIKPGIVYMLPRKGWAIEAYANVLSLDAQYYSSSSSKTRSFALTSGLTTNFPTYFSIRIAKYISPANIKP